MGLKTLHEMETIINVSSEKYGRVGFGLLVTTRMAPLMFLGFGQPKLRAWLHEWFIHFSLSVEVVVSTLCC